MPTAPHPAPTPAARSDDCGPGPVGLAALLLAFLAARFPEVATGDHTFVYRDFGLQSYPTAMHFRRSFWLGELPLWNPYSSLGLPFLAQWYTGVLYPPALIYLLLPAPWGLGIFCLAHVAFAGVAMFLLARGWLGDRTAAAFAGVSYACSGLMLCSLEWPAYLAVLAWAPLVVLTAERAWREGGVHVARAAVVGALQMLGGVPELIALTWILVAVVCAGSAVWGGARPVPALARLGAVAGLVSVLCAAQLLPFLQLVALSGRGEGYGTNYWAMPAWGLANLLVPLFHTARSIQGVTYQHGQELLGSYYLGIAPLALALLAARRAAGWRVFVLLGVAVAALAMAMGSNGPVYDAARALLPQLGYLRYPVKFVFLAGLVVPLLAAFAVRAHLRSPPRSWRRLGPELGLAAALVLAIGAVVAWAQLDPIPGEFPRPVRANGAMRAGLLCALLAGVVALPRLAPGAARRAAILALLAGLAFDGLAHARLAPTAPVEVYGPLRLRMTPVPRLGASRAMLSREARRALLTSGRRNLPRNYRTQRRSLLQQTNLLPAVPKVGGSFSLQLAHVEALDRLVPPKAPVPDGLADLFGVSQLLVLEGEALVWRPRGGALPLATAGQRPRFGGGPAALVAPDFDPRRDVLLRPEDRGRVSVRRGTRVGLRTLEIGADRLELAVEAREPALVVLAQSHHPGWRARLDGEPVPLLRANHAFQAVEVPAGRHRLRLRYEDPLFRWGSFVSGAGWIGCVGWIGWAWRARGGGRSSG